MRVICLKHGTKYGAEWVTRLKALVARHMPLAHEFVCYTENPVEGVTCEPLPSGLQGWWAKIGLFEPGIQTGPTLYFDLDVIPQGNLSCFVRPDDGKVWALDDFSYSLLKPKVVNDPYLQRMLGGSGTVNSSVMFWHGDAGRKVWDDFTPDVMERLHGDQNWITQALWPDNLSLFQPRLACSYKYHVLRGDPHGVVTVFHGQPKPNELSRSDALRQVWEAA